MKINTIIIIALLLMGCYGLEPEKTGFEGKPIPSFTLLLQDSTYFNTESIPSGNPVALYSFSPRCPYCRAQMEEIIEDIDKLKGIQFYIFTNFPFAEMKEFYKKYDLGKYPNIICGIDTANFFAKFYEIKGVPYTAIYSRDKILTEAFVGEVYSNKIRKAAGL